MFIFVFAAFTLSFIFCCICFIILSNVIELHVFNVWVGDIGAGDAGEVADEAGDLVDDESDVKKLGE